MSALHLFRAGARAALLGTAVLVAATAAHAQSAADRDTLRMGSPVVCPTRGIPASGSASPCVYTHWPAYETLTKIDLKGEVTPLLAVEWKNVEPTKWQVKVRPGVTFHNGDTLDAEDLATWFGFLGMPDSVKYVSAQNFQRQARIVGAKAISADTVEITTQQPNALLPRLLSAYWIPSGQFVKDSGVEGLANTSAGSGPFKVASWTDTEVKYVAHEAAWRKPKIGNLRVINIPETATRFAGVVSGEIDIAIGVPIDRIEELKREGHQVHVVERSDINSLRFNWYNRDTPFKDVRVRQAANYAIDRDSIQQNLMKGIVGFTGQCATPTNFGYNPDVKPYPYDPAKAKALLAEAGFPNGFGPIKIDVIPGNFPADGETYQAVAQYLNAIGIKAELQQITFAEWLKKWTPGPDAKTMGFPDMFQNGCMNFTAHPLDAMVNLSCRKPQPSHCIEEESKLIEQIEGAFDVDQQRTLVRQLLKVNHDNAAFLDLPIIPDITGLNKRVQGFENVAQRYSFDTMTLAN